MEVIYTGLRQTPEMIASAAEQEDVDVIGLSILSGAHNTICPQLMELLHAKHMDDVTVLVGGIIPEADIPGLKKAGIAEDFPARNLDSGNRGFRPRSCALLKTEQWPRSIPSATLRTYEHASRDPHSPQFARFRTEHAPHGGPAYRNQKRRGAPAGGRRRKSRGSAAQERPAHGARAHRAADRSENRILRAWDLRRLRNVSGMGRRAGGGHDYRPSSRRGPSGDDHRE